MGITRNEKKKHSFDRRLPLRLLSASLGLSFAPMLSAGSWSIAPQVTLQEIFSDNITLAADGAEDADFVTELTPALHIQGSDLRYKVDLDYAMQNLIYADNTDDSDIIHLLGGTGLLEAVPDRGFLEVGTDMRPVNVDTQGRVGTDNFNITDNRVDVFEYTVTPYWVQPFRNFAVADVRYTFDEAISFDEDTLPSSQEHTVHGVLRSASHFTDVMWNLDYFESHVDLSSTDTTPIFRTVIGRADYFFLPNWAVIGQLGYDANEFAGVDEETGVLWGVGLKWAPSRHTSAELIGGERFYGTMFGGRLSHEARRLKWVATYTEELTTAFSTILRSTAFPVLDQFGQPIISPVTGQPERRLVTTATATDEAVVDKILTTTLGFTGHHHDFELGFVDERRDFQVTGDEETIRTVTGTWTWRFGPRTSSLLALGWTNDEFRDGRQADYYTADLALRRRFGRNLEATVGGRYYERSAEGGLAEWTENRAYVMLVKTWQ